MKKNPVFSSLTYEPLIKMSRKEAQKELDNEKAKRRLLHSTDRVEWERYKKETKPRLAYLQNIMDGKN